MKKKNIILLTALLMISLSSCLEDMLSIRGNGIIVTESRRSRMFSRLENSTSIDVVYKKADSTSVTITADENLMDYIITENYDNTLEIRTRHSNTILNFRDRPLITITSPELDEAVISGSGTFIADEMSGNTIVIKISGSGDISADKVEGADLTVMLSGSGHISIKDCQCGSTDLFLSGSGSINIKGAAEDNKLKITGSGEVFAEDLLMVSASVIITGSGSAFTNIEHALTGIITGSGNIYVRGNPTINQTITGSGRIIHY